MKKFMEDFFKNAKILIVDDQPANIEVLKDLLDLRGFNKVYTTLDSLEVEKMVKEIKPDLLMLDLMMPNLSGFDIMNILKKEGLLNGLMPILVLTADASLETKQRALASGASDFITKPFDLVEVTLRTKNLLSNVFLLTQLGQQNELLEAKVKERTAKLEEINEFIMGQNNVLKEIAWIQSHVVRAPLARLMGIVSLLESQTYSEELSYEKLISLAMESANEIDVVIRDITDKSYKYRLFEDKNE